MCTESDLDFIKRCAREGKVYWSYHSNMRLEQRGLDRDTVFDSAGGTEIIEEYPTAKPFASCLCLGRDRDGGVLHYNVALDRPGDNIRMVTVYRPDPLKWEDGFRRRRGKDGVS